MVSSSLVSATSASPFGEALVTTRESGRPQAATLAPSATERVGAAEMLSPARHELLLLRAEHFVLSAADERVSVDVP